MTGDEHKKTNMAGMSTPNRNENEVGKNREQAKFYLKRNFTDFIVIEQSTVKLVLKRQSLEKLTLLDRLTC